MIIKTRLAAQSRFYRHVEIIQETELKELINEIIKQWDLPGEPQYSLVGAQDSLIIDKAKEWNLFYQLHSAEKEHEFLILPTESLHKLLPTGPLKQAQTTSRHPPIETSEPKKAPPPAQPKFAFHSVEPQQIGARKTYAERIDEEARLRRMNEAVSTASARDEVTEPAPSSSAMDPNGAEEESAYDRMMARSRTQGESLNKLFGSIMAKRSGASVDEQPAAPDATVNAEVPAVVEREEEEAPATTSESRKQPKEDVHARNAWMENAWEQRLKEMGHSGSTGSYYARMLGGKGKAKEPEAEEDSAQEASSSNTNANVASAHSEEALEDVAPLQASLSQNTSPIIAQTPRSPGPSYSVPNSRPGSTSGRSFSGRSSKASFSRFLRKGQRKKHDTPLLFSSQPPSLYGSGTATPDENNAEEGTNVSTRRRRAFSLRSLSDALLRERRASEQPKGNETDTHQTSGLSTTNPNPDPIPHVDNGEVVDQTVKKALNPQGREEAARPTLLRASHSVPLSSTAVNLSSAGGITLHISSVGAFGISQEDQEPVKSNLFDLMLPREIRVKCFKWLVKIHEAEGMSNSKSRSGSEAAARELVRFSRISRTWQSLVLDGLLWTSIDCSQLSGISNASLLRLTRSAGPFVKGMNLQHVPHISSSLLVSMTSTAPKERRLEEGFRFKSMLSVPTLASMRNSQFASLTKLSLAGCRNISTETLHSVLVRLPAVVDLDISNSDSVNHDTCLLLGASLPNLVSLDVSRCPNLSAKGIVGFVQAAQGALYDKALFSTSTFKDSSMERQEDFLLPLETLRAANCSGFDGDCLAVFGKVLRSLKALDLSYSPDLNDGAIAAFVEHPGPVKTGDKAAKKTTHQQQLTDSRESPRGPFITLSPRQAGGDVRSDEPHYRRLMPSLRHICLSSCRRLTDRSCVYLAYAVPNLQILEMANIGQGIREEGLVKLFETTPLIQKVDLEGASEIDDKVLTALTPDLSYVESIGWGQSQSQSQRGRRSLRRSRQEERESVNSPPPRQQRRKPSPPGAKLTHLILSNVTKPSQDILLLLIRRCPLLTHIQLDDTKANDAVLKEFVSLCRQRESRGAYISLVDCRALSRNANSEALAHAGIRPREGRKGRVYKQLEYSNEVPLRNGGSSSSSGGGRSYPDTSGNMTTVDECDDRLIVVKTFFNWETRSQQRRIQQRRNQRAMSASSRLLGKGRRDSLGAALAFIGAGSAAHHHGVGRGVNDDDDEEDGGAVGRWGRFTHGLMGQGDEAEDSRACLVM